MKREALAAVTAKFMASLTAKADEIEGAARLTASAESCALLVTLMHKLAGAAGFYGEIELAELAVDLERRLDPSRSEQSSDAAIAHDLERLVRLLRSRAAAAG